MESFADRFRAFFLALAGHALLIALVWFGFDWLMPPVAVSAAGEPIQATVQVSASELRKARAAIEKAAKAEPVPEPVAPPPQPIPEPRPQVSDTPVQEVPQAPVEKPDTVDQERITRLAQEQADKQALQEQELRQRQEQVDLTEDIARQQLIERRQRLRELAELTREREAATRRTKLEEQRLQQLADMRSAKPTPTPRAAASPPAGDRGVDEGLLAKYKSAMNQTADANWTHIGASELINCEVRFTQIPGGLVRTVEFLNCPFAAEGREFVERALKKTPMPYSGFESVFQREVSLKFCYPKEECTR